MTWMGIRAAAEVWYVLFLDLRDVFMGIPRGRNLWTVQFYFVSFSVI